MSEPVTRRRSSDPLTEQARVLASLRHDPLGFVEWAFPWGEPGGPLAGCSGPEPWQRDVLEAVGRGIAQAPDGSRSPVRVAVASGHGVGKSALVAWLILWAAVTDPATRGVVTANTETQLRTKTWAELAKWHRLAVTAKWNELGAASLVSTLPVEEGAGRIDMVPWSAHNAEAFAGLHNKGSRILLVFDEASAIADPIWETAEGSLTDAGTEIIWVVFGNPTRPSGRFFECFDRFRDRWHASQVDSRQVSLTDKQQLAQWVADYGEDSDFVKVRVRGLFPRAGTLQFIDSESVAAAMDRAPDIAAERGKPLVMGVDVARFGADRSVIVLRRGRDAKSWPIEKYQGLDTMTLAAKVVERAAAEGVRAVFVDEGGVGAGVVDRLRQLGVPFVFGINFGSKPETWDSDGAKPLYANKRAEIWGNMKAWLAQGCLVGDPELMADLTGLQYGYDPRSAIQLEKKEDMEKRGLASPDIGDALALTFALPVTGAAWDLTRGQNFYETDYDLDAEFDDDYWYGNASACPRAAGSARLHSRSLHATPCTHAQSEPRSRPQRPCHPERSEGPFLSITETLMCLFSMPAMPAPPPMPPAPPPPPAPPVTPTQADPAVKAARDNARRRAAGLQGYRSTIATSGLGICAAPPPLTTALKTLLGQ